MAYNPKKPNLPIQTSSYNPIFDKDRKNEILKERASLESYYSPEILGPRIQFQEAQDRIRKDNNLNLNSLKMISRKAFN